MKQLIKNLRTKTIARIVSCSSRAWSEISIVRGCGKETITGGLDKRF